MTWNAELGNIVLKIELDVGEIISRGGEVVAEPRRSELVMLALNNECFDTAVTNGRDEAMLDHHDDEGDWCYHIPFDIVQIFDPKG